MRAQDVMTTQVITVRPDAPVREVARIMVEHRISGLPVQDEHGRLLGIVTDGDIYRRAELGTARDRRRNWLSLFIGDALLAEDYVEAHGRTARDVMTSDVIAVAPGTSLRQIADLFETRRIRRVPVAKDGKVIGIVSRANLVQALAASSPSEPDGGTADRRIRDLVLAEYARRPWGLRSENNVIVKKGVVHLWGLVVSEAERDALRVAAESIPGVKGFEDHTIRYFCDVSGRPGIHSDVTVVGPEPGG